MSRAHAEATARGHEAWHAGERRATLDAFGRASFYAELLGGPQLEAQSQLVLATAMREFGELARAGLAVASAHALAARARDPLLVRYCTLERAALAIDEAEHETARDALALARSGADGDARSIVALAPALALALAGEDETALRALLPDDELLAEAQRTNDSRALASVVETIAGARFALGATRSAQTLLARTLARTQRSYRCVDLYLRVARIGCESDVAFARRSLAAVAGYGSIALFDAIGALRRGEHHELRPLAAVARDCGRAGGRLRDAREALFLLEAAAPRHLERRRTGGAGAPLERYLVDDDRAEGTAGSDCKPLTPRQAQIAELAAGGARNREIGEHLGISVHTVERHVNAILRRRGLYSRTQLTVSHSD